MQKREERVKMEEVERERERLSRGKPKSIKYSKKILGTYILREKYT